MAAAYAQPGAMRAGFEVFHAFEQDAQDFTELAQTKLTMAMLVLAGEKASGNFLIEQVRFLRDGMGFTKYWMTPVESSSRVGFGRPTIETH
jgi:hypothetical protein